MKTYTYKIDKQPIANMINFSLFEEYSSVLVQIFCGHDRAFLQELTNIIKESLPKAHCLGTTTDGEIEQDHIYTELTIISISVFEHTKIKSAYANTKDSFQNGINIAKELIDDKTKLIIAFTDGTSSNGEAFLKGIESVSPDTVISGGMAGDNGLFVQTYVSEGTTVLPEGAVGVSLGSDFLHVYNDFSFNWSPIGIEHIVDKVDDNRVYSIDGMSPVDFYAKYLGAQVADELPVTGIEFPLIVEKNGTQLARAVIARHDDDSLSFAGNLLSGDKVRLGFGNAKMIMREPLESFHDAYEYPIETFFVYSCMARRRYMPDFIQMEMKPFARTATTVGFFTYGEFYHHGKHNELLNQTFTVVALSESIEHVEDNANKPKQKPFRNHNDYSSTIEALTHLIDISTDDYEEQARELEKQKLYSQQLLEAQKIFLRHAIHETNTPLSVIMANIELFELYFGKHPNLTNIEVATKSIHSIYDDLSYLIRKEQVEYPKKIVELVDFIRSRLDFFDVVAKRSMIAIELNSEKEQIYININETKLQRIVDNNISNAIKYTKASKSIKVSISDTNSHTIVEIISHSSPIRDVEGVFEAYYREDYAKDGLGLGLNLVKQICDEEGIKIVVSSSKKQTKFCYHFPKDSK
ncbi:MAG TPA: diguanylate cyclase [Sulfurovum sp.]|nr:diguanylate cyclase [Sulfurovum sp.]